MLHDRQAAFYFVESLDNYSTIEGEMMMVNKWGRFLHDMKPALPTFEHAALSSLEHSKLGKLFGPYVRTILPEGKPGPVKEAIYPVFDRAGISTNAIGRFLTSLSSKNQVVFYTPTPPAGVVYDTSEASAVAWKEALTKEHLAITCQEDGPELHDSELVGHIKNKIKEAFPRFSKDVQSCYEVMMKETLSTASKERGHKP